jgi:hypothetical protein
VSLSPQKEPLFSISLDLIEVNGKISYDLHCEMDEKTTIKISSIRAGVESAMQSVLELLDGLED